MFIIISSSHSSKIWLLQNQAMTAFESQIVSHSILLSITEEHSVLIPSLRTVVT